MGKTEQDTEAIGAEPRQWAAGTVGRGVGAFCLAMAGAAVYLVLTQEFTWSSGVLIAGAAFWTSAAATGLNWRVTADRSGVWVTGAWAVKAVPWEEIQKVVIDHDSFAVHRAKGTTVTLRPTGVMRLERRSVAGHAAGRAADAVRAMLADPELRPARDSVPGEQGMPLGPVLVVGLLAWGACVYWLF
ncbi:hypothetical protein ACIO3O_26570 [Streptomyces sp. NPDC087440]|uniref:hypothetical protein n=1 Tax=Streptomyces sp. NPDC087440 TaxID=3365790 RepID=UPI00381D9243